MKIEGDYIIFDDDARFRSEGGIIALDKNMEITNPDDVIDNKKLTTTQRLELADYMITLWIAYRAKAQKERGIKTPLKKGNQYEIYNRNSEEKK